MHQIFGSSDSLVLGFTALLGYVSHFFTGIGANIAYFIATL